MDFSFPVNLHFVSKWQGRESLMYYANMQLPESYSVLISLLGVKIRNYFNSKDQDSTAFNPLTKSYLLPELIKTWRIVLISSVTRFPSSDVLLLPNNEQSLFRRSESTLILSSFRHCGCITSWYIVFLQPPSFNLSHNHYHTNFFLKALAMFPLFTYECICPATKCKFHSARPLSCSPLYLHTWNGTLDINTNKKIFDDQ